jgi:hypothetical protein
VSLSAIPRSLRIAVFARDAGRCRYCHLSQTGQGTIFHINHVVPKSKGGGTVADNLVLQSPHCSLHKSERTFAADPQGMAQVHLFHPLQQDWSEHFAMLPDGTCIGLTATGRATVEALRLRSELNSR